MADYFSNFVEYFPRLMEGLKLTIIIAIFGILLAVALGIILCIFSISNSRILQKIASVYITIIRGIPLMILALFLYFGVIKNSLTLVLAAIIILGINASAYMAEIFRAGIQAIDYGQMEAARSLEKNCSSTGGKNYDPVSYEPVYQQSERYCNSFRNQC